MYKKLMVFAMLGITIIGQGFVPPTAVNAAQGKMLARRAAITDVFRQLGSNKGIHILTESFDGQTYTIEAAR